MGVMMRVATVMKRIKYLVGAVIGLVLLGAVVAYLGLGAMWKAALERYGSEFVEVPVSVERVRVRPMAGIIEVYSLVVGNPEGFKTKQALSVERMELALEWRSLFSSKTRLHLLDLHALEATYERALLKSNLGVISKTVQAKVKKPEELDKRLKRPLQVDEVILESGRVNATATLLGGRGIGMNLPDLHLKDLGTDPAGITVAELASEILRSIVENAVAVSVSP